MNPRERILAILNHRIPDRLPRFEVWIDALHHELGVSDPYSAYAELGQDAVLLPSQTPARSNAWKSGVDEWGRVWKDGLYVSGEVASSADLVRYNPPLDFADAFFDEERARTIRARFPEHCLFFGTHIGPFMASYMAMGLARFCERTLTDPPFIHALLAARTDWCLAVFTRAAALGAEVIVMGDDAAHHGGPLVSPQMWREFVLPLHRRIAAELPVPVIWHSDGNIASLLPMAIEAGFAGVHGLEPWSMSLAQTKAECAGKLALLGNVDVRTLCAPDVETVRREVRRCTAEGGPSGFMLSTCNSIFPGMNAIAVREFFRYQAEWINSRPA
jgi:uroporphyrinogen decarboxylase